MPRTSGLFLLAALLLCLPAHAALVFTLDAPNQTALPGEVLSFTGTILNTGPEVASLGINQEFNPLPAAPFTVGIPIILAGFTPGPGDQYAGEIFAILVDPTALPGDTMLTLASISAAIPGGSPIVSNNITVRVTVEAVPEPGTAVLLAIPALALLALRRYAPFFPKTR